MIANANSISIPLTDQSVHCVVTSPPYWGLRDYGLPPTEWPTVTYTPMAGLAPVTVQGCELGCQHAWGEDLPPHHPGQVPQTNMNGRGHAENVAVAQTADNGQYCQLCGGWRGCLGLEPTPEMFVAHIVAVFREVWRVLRDDGSLWLNFGDSYSAGGGDRHNGSQGANSCVGRTSPENNPDARVKAGLPSKNLIGIPWRVAFALQADGWYLRNDIIWHKPNPMPESVTDRCTKSHEYLFLLSKSQRYYYDNEAVKEVLHTDPKENYPARAKVTGRGNQRGHGAHPSGPQQDSSGGYPPSASNGRNRRTVWTIPTRGYSGAHFATFPPALVTPCILAGTSAKGVCPECGKPWKRVVEKTTTFESNAGKAATRSGNWNLRQTDHPRTDVGVEGHDLRYGPTVSSTTIGWQPTCEHYPLVYAWVPIPARTQDEPAADYAFRLAAAQGTRQELLDVWCDLPTVPAIVLDCFCGSGTVGEVCNTHGRKFVGIDLSSSYLRELALPRAENKCTTESVMELPLFAQEKVRE